MKIKYPALLVSTMMALISPRIPAAETSSGRIEGRVFNAATGAALANVRITVAGTNQETLTDEAGRFRLSGLRIGQARLTADYVGLESQTVAVEVGPSDVVVRDIELDRTGAAKGGDAVVKLGAINIVADREMSAQALAVNEQRHSPNIKNVVAREEFDYRGSENIGDFLAFLPGVGITNTGIEPQFVSLR